MTTRYYRNADGRYLGAFGAGVAVPSGAIEVATPPRDARQTWTGQEWGPAPVDPVLVPLAAVLTRIILGGHLDAVLAALQQNPSAAALLMNVREGVYSTDPDARALLAGVGADPDVILAP